MHLKRQLPGTLLLLLFIAAIAIVLHPQVTAGQQSGDHPQTAIGQPAQISLPAGAENQPPPAPAERTQLPASGLDTSTYLPLLAKSLLGAEAQAVVDLVNAERAQVGCPALRVSAQLTTAGQGHSEDMAFNDFFSHTSSNGDSPWDRIHATGYNYSSAAENIAAGYSTPASAVAGWMGSSGHRANILNCNLEETGVGYYYLQPDPGNVNYRHYWTQVFATPR